MVEEDIPKELMEYLGKLKKKLEEIRDEETKKEIADLINQLDTLKLSKGLTYNQLEELKENLKDEVLDKDEYSDYSFLPNLKFYFDSNFNYMAYSTRETKLLADNIHKLIKRINILNEELEEKQLKDMETQEATVEKEKPREEEKKKEDELLFDGEGLEEDEEVVVSVQQFLFECENCKDKSPNAYLGGCRKCGENNIKVSYL